MAISTSMYVYFFICALVLVNCNGFLFDDVSTTPSNGGSSLTDQHFITLIDMITREKQLRERYMLQLQQKIVKNERKASALEVQINMVNDTIVGRSEFEKLKTDLVRKYQSLEQKILENENKTSPINGTVVEKSEFDQLKTDFMQKYKYLEQSFTALRQDFAFVIDQNDKFKHQINSSNMEIKQLKKELSEQKKLNSNETQEIQNLKTDNVLVNQRLRDTTVRIHGIESLQQARGQELLFLHNQTNDMKMHIQSLDKGIIQQNQTSQLLKDEFHKGDMKIESKMRQFRETQNKTVLQIKESIVNITKEMKKVAVTACAKYGRYDKNVPIPFPFILTSYGMNNKTSLTSNGLFTCEHSGLYIVSVTLVLVNNNGYFQVYKNDVYLVDVYSNGNLEHWHSSSVMVVVDLVVNDTISVKPHDNKSGIYGSSESQRSCLTAVKVK